MISISMHCSVSISIIIIIILLILSTPDTAFWYSTRFYIILHISLFKLFTYVHYIRFYLPYGCCIITMWVSSLKCLDIFIIYFYSILENKTKIFFWSTLTGKNRLNPINTHTHLQNSTQRVGYIYFSNKSITTPFSRYHKVNLMFRKHNQK